MAGVALFSVFVLSATGLIVSIAGDSGIAAGSTMRATMAAGLANGGAFNAGALSARTSACSARDSVVAKARPRSALRVTQGAPDFLGG